MPITHSAERRMRNSARKRAMNRSRKADLKTVERSYVELVKSGKKEEATEAYKGVASALDKATKRGVIHRSKANRLKSRLAKRLNAAKAK